MKPMRRIVPALCLLMVMAGCLYNPGGTDVEIRILERWSGTQGGTHSFATRVINDATDWVEIWKLIGRDPPHTFDASETMGVAVFLGQRNTGGYSVEITDVHQAIENIRIEYIEHVPTPERRVAQVVTAPWTVALISRTSKRVEFSASTASGQHR
jgi:hypothetical protein